MSNSSNAATSPDSGQIERLERFFRAYRSAGPSDPTIQKAERLALLFDKIGPLLRQGLPTHPSRILPAQLDGNRLKACLAALKEPLGLARSSGEFTNVWAIAGLSLPKPLGRPDPKPPIISLRFLPISFGKLVHLWSSPTSEPFGVQKGGQQACSGSA